MSDVYLIRHGQAGTRDEYDSLSELGRHQASLLGQYFRSQGVNFSAAFSGEMSRQQQTARATKNGYGPGFPEIDHDPGWNEFDLDRIYKEIAPQMCAADAGFRREYEAMRRQVQASGGAQDAAVHRRWMPCDTALVDAWIAGSYEFAGESWTEFCTRVENCRLRRNGLPHRGNIAVFTSAVPIAIWTGLALEIRSPRLMRLAGPLLNTSLTILKIRDEHWRLFSFNATPHLPTPELRTFR